MRRSLGERRSARTEICAGSGNLTGDKRIYAGGGIWRKSICMKAGLGGCVLREGGKIYFFFRKVWGEFMLEGIRRISAGGFGDKNICIWGIVIEGEIWGVK